MFLLSGCAWNGKAPDGSGTIECTEVDLAPQVSGRIVNLAPQEGDRVKSGDVVARLDPADYLLKQAEAEAAVKVAKAQLDLLLAGSRQEDIDVRLDFVVRKKVVVELKAVTQLEAIHEAQLLTYMKLTNCRVGLLINFNVPTLKQGLKRMVL